MKLHWPLTLLMLGLGLAGCMTIEPAQTPADVERIVIAGDLPEVGQSAAEQLIKSSKVPVAILFTAEDCRACKAVTPDFWRTLRQGEGRFVGALLDTDKHQYFWRAHGKPELPAVIVFERGSPRWRVVGYHGIMAMREVLLTNQQGYVHGLTARQGERPLATTRVFLAAVNADSAAFGQEVVDQIVYWRSRGIKDEEIACYWSVPHFGSYWHDREQFNQLKEPLSRCYQADLSQMMADWRRAAAAKPAWIYFYATGHGTGDRQAKRALKAIKGAKNCPQLGKAHLQFDSMSTAPEAMYSDDFYRRACEMPAKDAPILTAAQMDVMLKVMPLATIKTVILQGCHSGGVVPRVLPARTTILTAASPERSSFGCNADSERTVYGAELLKALQQRRPNLFSHADWVGVHDAVFKGVTDREKELEIEKGERSLPMIYAGRDD